MIDHVLTRRVMRLYDPFGTLMLETNRLLSRVRAATPRPVHRPYSERDEGYHLGRIRYFMEEIAAGRGDALQPIELDNDWVRETIIGLVVVDGHHRLIAHAFAGSRTIPVDYSGGLLILDWLCGQIDECPLPY